MPKYKSQAVCERKITQLQAKIERTKTRLDKMENELRNLLAEKEQERLVNYMMPISVAIRPLIKQ